MHTWDLPCSYIAPQDYTPSTVPPCCDSAAITYFAMCSRSFHTSICRLMTLLLGTAEGKRRLYFNFHHEIPCVSSSQFVVVGGSWNRMGGFAEFIAREIGHPHVKREELSISKPGSDRFAFYKIGPVLSISVSSARVDCRVEHIAKISFLSYCCHK